LSDDVRRRDEIESPCVKVCVVHPGAGLCVGCLRSLDEIAGWSGMTPAARAAVMADLPGRADRLTGLDVRPSRRRAARLRAAGLRATGTGEG
jgi:predicted Fe-S protein YdhL (DUF1289 family)